MMPVKLCVAALALLILSACGDGPEVGELPYDDVRQAKSSGEAAFAAYFPNIKGQTVRWTGRVVEVLRQRDDDFIEVATLRVDFDPAEANAPDADAEMRIPLKLADTLKAGDTVTVVATLREFQAGKDGILLRMEHRRNE